MLFIGCCTNYKFSNRKIQPYLKSNVTRILWCVLSLSRSHRIELDHDYMALFICRLIWGSVCLFVIFLAASWVFALLLVNVYGIDSGIVGWVFMVASILLVGHCVVHITDTRGVLSLPLYRVYGCSSSVLQWWSSTRYVDLLAAIATAYTSVIIVPRK